MSFADFFRRIATKGQLVYITCPQPGGRVWGYYNDADALAADIETLAARMGRMSSGTLRYTLNPVDPAWIERVREVEENAGLEREFALNAIMVGEGTGRGAGRKSIAKRRWLMVDIDPVRAGKGHATEAEHMAARELAREIRAGLKAKGCADPVALRSPSGVHLYYRVDLPRADKGLCQDVLATLADIYNDGEGRAHVDPATYKPGQMGKLPGFAARKNWRSKDVEVLHMPEDLRVTPAKVWESLAREKREERKRNEEAAKERRERQKRFEFEEFDMAGFVSTYLGKSRPGHRENMIEFWELERCPKGSHSEKWKAWAGVRNDGVPLAGCLACDGNGSHWEFNGTGGLREGMLGKGRRRGAWKKTTPKRRRKAPAEGEGATVHQIHTPPPPVATDGSVALKVDQEPPALKVADVPADSSTEQLEAQVEARKKKRKAKKKKQALRPMVWEQRPSAGEIASRAIAELDTGGEGIVCDDDALWRYDPELGTWVAIDDDEVRRKVLSWDLEDCGGERFEATWRMMNDTVSICRTSCKRPGFFDDETPGFVMRDCFVHADVEAGHVFFIPRDKRYRSRAAVDADVLTMEQSYREGKMLWGYLGTIHGSLKMPENPTPAQRYAVEDARAKVRLMGEVLFAALAGLGPHFNQAVLAKGEAGCGKSQWLLMAEALVPKGVQCTIEPHSIGHEYYNAQLAGKRLNVVMEVEKNQTMKAIGGFKAAISGEPVPARHPAGRPFSCVPRALHLIAGNDLPVAPGAGQAFFDRWVVVGFEGRFRKTEEEIKDLGKKIVREELDAVMGWVLECGRGLIRRGAYTEPPSSKEHFRKWRAENDTVVGWVEYCDEVSIGNDLAAAHWPKATESYTRYVNWSESQGHKRTVNARTFSKRLQAMGVQKAKSRGIMRYSLTFTDTII